MPWIIFWPEYRTKHSEELLVHALAEKRWLFWPSQCDYPEEKAVIRLISCIYSLFGVSFQQDYCRFTLTRNLLSHLKYYLLSLFRDSLYFKYLGNFIWLDLLKVYVLGEKLLCLKWNFSLRLFLAICKIHRLCELAFVDWKKEIWLQNDIQISSSLKTT